MNRKTYGMALLVSIALMSGTTQAQDPAEIRSRGQEFIKALSKGDAEAVAALWTPTGEYTRGEITIRGRDNIRKAYAEHFKQQPSGELKIEEDTVRFLSDGVAVQEGTFVMDRANPAKSIRSRFSALYVKVEDNWHFGLLREESDRPSVAELAWMAGEWKFKTDNAEGIMSARLTKAKTFMLVQTTVKEGDEELSATQVIGIDPATGGLKSWTFESDGSIGTGEWVRTETGWLATITATTSVGEEVKAVTTITPASRDAFTFQTTERTIDGEKAPDIEPVKVTRARANN